MYFLFIGEQPWAIFNGKKYDATDDNQDVIIVNVILRQDNVRCWHKADFRAVTMLKVRTDVKGEDDACRFVADPPSGSFIHLWQ